MTCATDGCDKPVRSRGLCANHYQRAKMRRELDAYPLERRRDRTCSLEGCDEKHYAADLCNKHYARKRRHGDPTVLLIAEKGTGWVDAEGYRRVWRKGHPNSWCGGFIDEHVFVMAESLGRALLPQENVHHKNGDRADNRLKKGHAFGGCPPSCCNLELWSTKQPRGQRVADKLAWARELLATYGNDPSG